jgi:uncharacterized protein YdcH (DUF465 family)
MSHTPHELAEDFPDKVERIQVLKGEDAHFRRLCDEYHEVNRAVHRAECGDEPTDDFHETELRRRRMGLKDQIARRLAEA